MFWVNSKHCRDIFNRLNIIVQPWPTLGHCPVAMLISLASILPIEWNLSRALCNVRFKPDTDPANNPCFHIQQYAHQNQLPQDFYLSP